MKKTTILFDLDGTLVNTERGITNCVQLALKAFGITDAAPGTLRRFIGPPVEESFQREYGFSVEKAKEATAIFRREYRVTGVNECELYPGVEDALKALRQKRFRIGLASSKPEPFCLQILERFQVARYFDAICGAQIDKDIRTKIQVLEVAVERLHISDPGQAVLIGDTRYDARGAQEAGIACIGVSYGFEHDFEEMRRLGVTEIFDSLSEVVSYLG